MEKAAVFLMLALGTLSASAQDGKMPDVQGPVAAPVVRPFSIYSNGVYSWPGDYSYQATINYSDTKGAPPTGTKDIAVTVTSAWGAWQPYATNSNFNRVGYGHLVFKLKPTRTDSNFSVQFLKVGDITIKDPNAKDGSGFRWVAITDYGPALRAGEWATYKIPLDVVLNDNGTILKSFYKFAIQSHSGTADLFYLTDVAITP